MHNNEGQEMAQYQKVLDELPIPEAALDAAILKGFEKAKLQVTRPRRAGRMGLAIAAVIIIGFFTSIKVSPAFAGYMSDIPGIGKLVDFIQGDKGMIAAFESEYDQEVGVSSKDKDVTFTIERAIADENGLVLFYSIETSKEDISVDSASLESRDGSELVIGTIGYGMPVKDEEDKSFTGMMEFYYQKPSKAKSFSLKATVGGTEHSLDFTLKKDIHGKKEYLVNKTIIIEGQEVTIENIEMYPLRAAIHVTMGAGNSKKLLSFDSIQLIDERGEIWGNITNGITASGVAEDENKKIVYLQSNYFREPKELYLVVGKIQAVNKNEAEIVIDTETMIIKKQPASKKFSDLRVENEDVILKLNSEKRFPYFPFSKVKSADGKEKYLSNSFNRSGEGFGNEFGFSLTQVKGYANPISLELSFYPEWIESKEKIRIK
ncbi:DUF4179 domain-containing protein [Bacillus sp. EB01]|uniref:DUF4179 domain-containing protein n=1 Tax=Bacillus sp. EB01 TaxID=1347086 RepID=UPI0005C61EF4|nr:DUF4179 domain-containing protein [Bacillus sp. EB01]